MSMTLTAPDGILQARSAGNSLTARIGNTPLIPLRLPGVSLPADVRVFGKAEWANPGGSVKDRPAWRIVRAALRRGELGAGRTLIDSTSGNTGIAYAMLGAALGFAVQLFLPANISPARLSILRACGAELVLTDPLEGSDGALRAARALIQGRPRAYFYADQYNNPANIEAHHATTGAEIWRQSGGGITHLVAGMGTSGTLMGSGRRLREHNPALQIISVQPDAPFHGLEGLKHMATAIRPGLYDPLLADRDMAVSTEATHALARRLAREEGLLVGISAAAALVAARQLAQEQADRARAAFIVAILPDSADKYLSESFWQA